MRTNLALIVLLAACGGSGNSDFDAFMKLDSEKAAAFSVGGKDCKEKAKSVGEWRSKHSAEYKALQSKLKESFGKEPPKDLMEKYGDAIKANKKAVISAMFDCTKDPDFEKMMDATKD